MKICVAGAYGAFGLKHLDALKNIDDVEVFFASNVMNGII